ncbi:MAG: MaoC/PaaZ C-terminal domain-containing protein [Myxococcales bacterium]|nr:MaoC family dehydratase N-terminal domain-containing protein [Myxococcales bacterium]
MSSRSAARKVRPTPKAAHHKPAHKAAPKKGKKLAKVTRFPSHKVARKPMPAPKKHSAPKKHGHSRPPEPQHVQQRNLPPLTAPKQVQQPKQSLARSFYWTELRVGDDLPPLTKPAIDRVQIVRYASSAGDFNRLHLDEPYAHQVGFPGLFAPGMLPMAFVGQLLTAWLRRGHVRKLSARFIKIVWPNDELTCHGRIAELRREGGACYADVELWAENQKGELVLRGIATCELYESPQQGGGDGGGLLFALQNPPSATPSRKSAPPPSKHRRR